MICRSAAVVCMLLLPALAQAQAGAKAAFTDRSSDVVVVPVDAKPPSGSARTASSAPKLYVPAVTGLMYWIEMRDDRNQLVRVNANRQFKTGERIRLHVTSN